MPVCTGLDAGELERSLTPFDRYHRLALTFAWPDVEPLPLARYHRLALTFAWPVVEPLPLGYSPLLSPADSVCRCVIVPVTLTQRRRGTYPRLLSFSG